MTAIARTFKQTEREKLPLRWRFRILGKTDFYGENGAGSDIGSRAKSQPKITEKLKNDPLTSIWEFFYIYSVRAELCGDFGPDPSWYRPERTL